ncbi:hypothetical protein [Cryobacterium arcticum]|uniref:Uncharacterized protein n=1 Tax=Cryobacterium arcticum TaxID=670052 RepID=A0A1B1BPP5_9MICO|nr:hypothetical protein [Cryobacterium arcticum]ANP74506.1 hypothetical protein PA27867_3585 [Cryobacterium arcticum]
MTAPDDFPCCAPVRKPTKKEQIAELTGRVDAMGKDLSAQDKRHREELDRRDRALAAAGFIRAENVTDLIMEADPWHVSYTAKVSLSEGVYKGLRDWTVANNDLPR